MNAATTPDDIEPPLKTPPRTICNSSSRTEYAGAELTTAPARPRASNALAIPSRVGNRLHPRSGLVTDHCSQPTAL